MEPASFFLILLLVLLAGALLSGFPVAFSLPGAALLTFGAAALSGYVIEGNIGAYIAGSGQDLIPRVSDGIRNYKSLFAESDRDTLIAIPLFIFMGILLQRSKIAEDLLVTMAQLFGPVPGGLAISVVIVGALLAATTGIVGATVVAMGLISLPIMLKNKYNVPLATGTISASGTLGQIIPPSIVLIILADQLGSAAEAGANIRKDLYESSVGGFVQSLPPELAVTSASAGDMFLGALIPGALIMVPIYILYILVVAFLRPGIAPPVRFSRSEGSGSFLGAVFLSLIPPLALIVLVLGSILAGIATVNQAGAIGAAGAILMAGYRLMGANRMRHFAPTLLVFAALVALWILGSVFNLNVQVRSKTSADILGMWMAAGAVLTLVLGLVWSAWRVYKCDDILRDVLTETAKTTSMVFLILLGAAMLTTAFRAFGGEELVKEFLTSLPGGFMTQFLVVMLVMFILGFFLDFIEIAVVVVPITAPILLADPSANISAIWLGVMIGINIQTSFLTPPFGFALFYLRGVAPPEVKTLQIYRGVLVFIGLQLLALGIVGMNERLANFLPRYATLLRDTAPPPSQPALQACIEPIYLAEAMEREQTALQAGQALNAVSTAALPSSQAGRLGKAAEAVPKSYQAYADLEAAQDAYAQALARDVRLDGETLSYTQLHKHVRAIERRAAKRAHAIAEAEEQLRTLERYEPDKHAAMDRLRVRIARLEIEREDLAAQVPAGWAEELALTQDAHKAVNKARLGIKRLDNAYTGLRDLNADFDRAAALSALAPEVSSVGDEMTAMQDLSGDALAAATTQARTTLAALKAKLSAIGGVSKVTTPISKIDRALKKDAPEIDLAVAEFAKVQEAFIAEVAWREHGAQEVRPGIAAFFAEVDGGVAMRTLPTIPAEYRRSLAWCQSAHRDVSLQF